jgi:hypothetical protein
MSINAVAFSDITLHYLGISVHKPHIMLMMHWRWQQESMISIKIASADSYTICDSYILLPLIPNTSYIQQFCGKICFELYNQCLMHTVFNGEVLFTDFSSFTFRVHSSECFRIEMNECWKSFITEIYSFGFCTVVYIRVL